MTTARPSANRGQPPDQVRRRTRRLKLATPLHQWNSVWAVRFYVIGQTDLRQAKCRVPLPHVERGRSQGGGVTGSGGLEDPRQRPTAATMDLGTMTLPSVKARQSRISGLGVTISELEPEAWLRSSPQTFDRLTGPRSRIARQPLRVVKPGPCRLRNFASGLSALASLRTGFHICSALSPTKAPSGRAAIGRFRRAALRRLLS